MDVTPLRGSHIRFAGNQKLEEFVNRRDIDTGEGDSEQVVVSFQGFPIGHGIIDRGRLLSRFPRIGWDFRLTIDD